MEIKFGEYRIASNDQCYTLYRLKGYTLDKNGEQRERWEPLEYHRKLEQLTASLPDVIIRRTNGNLNDAVAEMHRVSKQLTEACTAAIWGEDGYERH